MKQSPLPIITDTGNKAEILHQKTQRIKNIDSPEIQKLIADMFDSLHSIDIGIGLAAPQIGSSLRLAIIEFDDNRMVMINPKITSFSREKILFEEGCLSIPGKYLSVERFEKVTVRYQDEHGKEVKKRASGLLAIAIQHEVDHLDGILIKDRIKNQKQHKAYSL